MMSRSFATTSTLKASIVMFAAAGLVAIGLPAANARTEVAAAPAAVGNSCLVGTWHDNGGRTTTRFEGHRVVMRARGGDIDHIAASGLDLDSWSGSKPAVGTYRGHRLVETITGQNSLGLQAKGGTLTYTEKGWTSRSKNRYVYRGKKSKGYFNPVGMTFTTKYTCSATRLRFFGPRGRPVGSETRLSSTP
jgi:hypothetical protein